MRKKFQSDHVLAILHEDEDPISIIFEMLKLVNHQTENLSLQKTVSTSNNTISNHIK